MSNRLCEEVYLETMSLLALQAKTVGAILLEVNEMNEDCDSILSKMKRNISQTTIGVQISERVVIFGSYNI